MSVGVLNLMGWAGVGEWVVVVGMAPIWRGRYEARLMPFAQYENHQGYLKRNR